MSRAKLDGIFLLHLGQITVVRQRQPKMKSEIHFVDASIVLIAGQWWGIVVEWTIRVHGVLT